MGKQEMVPWMPDDDLKLVELYQQYGPRWRLVTLHFPGRTVASVRNRHLRVQGAAKIRREGGVTRNRCQLCGLPKKGHICQKKMGTIVKPTRSAVPAALSSGIVVDGSRALVVVPDQTEDDGIQSHYAFTETGNAVEDDEGMAADTSLHPEAMSMVAQELAHEVAQVVDVLAVGLPNSPRLLDGGLAVDRAASAALSSHAGACLARWPVNHGSSAAA